MTTGNFAKAGDHGVKEIAEPFPPEQMKNDKEHCQSTLF
jgi:hypothetical protein